MSRTGSGNQIGFAYAQPSSYLQTQPGQPGYDGSNANGNSNLNSPAGAGIGSVPARGRVNKAPLPGYNRSPDKPTAPQSAPPQSQSLNAVRPVASKIVDVEKGSENDDDAGANMNGEDEDVAEDGVADKSKGKRRGRIAGTQFISPGAKVWCCDLQSEVVTIGFFNVVLAFIAIIIFGMSFSGHRDSHCHQLGLGCGLAFILIGVYLIIGGFSRSSVICIIYLIISWLAFIGATVAIFVLDQCQNQIGVILYMLLVCGYLFKIYEGVVIYYFIKEPPPSPEQLRRSNYSYSYPAASYPVYIPDPTPVFIPYGGYGYGYRPYGYGYAYDPAVGMLTGMGLGMAMGGGFNHCHYDSCDW